jgi:hypothetical protein
MLVAQDKKIPQPIINRINEIDEKLEKTFFERNELSYLDQVKVQNFHNQIKKIYLKYTPKETQIKVKTLQDEITSLLNDGDIDVQRYARLDHELKGILNSLKKPTMMTLLDDARVSSFEERIDDIYSLNQPDHKELISVEELMKEKDSLLSLI